VVETRLNGFTEVYNKLGNGGWDPGTRSMRIGCRRPTGNTVVTCPRRVYGRTNTTVWIANKFRALYRWPSLQRLPKRAGPYNIEFHCEICGRILLESWHWNIYTSEIHRGSIIAEVTADRIVYDGILARSDRG